MAKSSDVILVHGVWADGSSWAKVIPLLAAKGHSITAVQLPLTSLGDDVATVKRAIALASGPIILAGHSYGGAVISEAGNDPKVEALVYIAAFAPDAGESAGSLGASVEPAPLGAEVRPDAEGYLRLTQSGREGLLCAGSDRHGKAGPLLRPVANSRCRVGWNGVRAGLARQDLSLPCRDERPRHPARAAAEHGQAPQRGGCRGCRQPCRDAVPSARSRVADSWITCWLQTPSRVRKSGQAFSQSCVPRACR